MRKATERQLAFAFGATFVVVLIALAVVVPNPTPFQYTVFRVVLALASAGVAVMIPGFLEVQIPGWVKAGGALAVFIVVYFYNPAALITQEPGRDPPSDFEVYSQQRTLDLSAWQFVPDGHAAEKLSPVIWKDTFKLRRLRPSGILFTIRHATTGVPTPDFSSPSHHISNRETTEKPQGGPRPKLRIFDVSADVSGEPVGEWFNLVIDATYWNACNNPHTSWGALPVVHPTQEAVFEIQFPSGKPVKTWERREGSRDTTSSELVTDASIEILDDRKTLRWKIDAPRLNWVYKFAWEW